MNFVMNHAPSAGSIAEHTQKSGQDMKRFLTIKTPTGLERFSRMKRVIEPLLALPHSNAD